MPAERLQKVLASAGVTSRRGAEAMIAAGRVTVDGKPAGPGTQVDPRKAVIAVDGRVIGGAVGLAYLVLHKPAGVTSTTADRHAETTVLDLVPTALIPDGARLYPVGRLDQDSEGMLLLTNDGAWADRVLHPRHGVEREYALGLDRPLTPDQAEMLREGIDLDEGRATLHGLRPMTAVEADRLADLLRPTPPDHLTWYRATLTQGWKRQLRRMFGAVGAPVQRLVRVRIGPVRLDGIRSGSIRPLKAPEIRGLGAGAGRSRAAASTSPEAGPRRTPTTEPEPAPDSQAPARRPRTGQGGRPGTRTKARPPRPPKPPAP